MDAQMTVPIAVVMKFAKMKALTQDEAVLRQALENCTLATVVDNKIKANIKSVGRSTIILREIPSDTPVEEVREIFNFEGCKPIGTIRSDIGDSWFVSMDSEEEAKDTLLDLRLKKRTFRGHAVKARLKTETVIRSFYPLQGAPSIPVGYPPMNFGFGYGLPLDMSGGMLPVPPVSDGILDENKADEQQTAPAANNGKSGKDRSDRKSQQIGSKTSGYSSSGANGRNGSRPAKGSAAQVTRPAIEINSANFPPLLTSEDTPVPTPGYKESYLKYTFEEIINIVKEVQDATLPATLNPANHPLAMTATVNLDLLKKQRTYSIDETREQLRQGRPVHREAITAGAVDYRSLMYGDESQQQHVSSTIVAAAPVIAAPVVHNTPSKPTGKARSNSQDVHTDGAHHHQTPKKISASSWAAMVKSSAAATTAVESATTPAKQPVTKTVASAAKTVVPASDKKAPAGGSKEGKGGERKRSSSKGGEPAAAKDGKVAEGKRDRKRAPKEGAAKEGKEPAKEVETAGAVTPSDSSAIDQSPTESAAASAGVKSAPWGGKTSFASIVKLKSTEEGVETTAAAPALPVKSVSAEKKVVPAASKPSKPSSGTHQSRPSSSAGKPAFTGERKPRGNSGTEGGARRTQSGAAAGASATANSGANASGVWVREALPALKK